MSTGQSSDRTLVKCDDCGHFAVASNDGDTLRPIGNRPGSRCPACGGTALSAHPLLDDEGSTADAA